MTMLGSDIPFQMFYTDNMYYMDMMGMKMKQEMPLTRPWTRLPAIWRAWIWIWL